MALKPSTYAAMLATAMLALAGGAMLAMGAAVEPATLTPRGALAALAGDAGPTLALVLLPGWALLACSIGLALWMVTRRGAPSG